MLYKTQKSELSQQNEETSAADQFSSSSQTFSDKPFVADQLNVERRVVLQLREGFGGFGLNKIHAAFHIFNVAATVASFCPLPHFELKDELLEAFKQYLLKGKQLSTADRYALSRVTRIGGSFFALYERSTGLKASFLSGFAGLNTIDLSSLAKLTTVGTQFFYRCSGTVEAQGEAFLDVTTHKSSCISFSCC